MEKVNYLINMIKNMNLKDKLRLAICLTDNDWVSIIYDKKELFEKFDSMLKVMDKEYRTTLINFSKYFNITFAMSKIIEMKQEERNKVALYLFNNI